VSLKALRLPKCLHWYIGVKRHWMISLPGTPWSCIGSPDMLEYDELKSPTSSQGVVQFRSIQDLSHPWGSLGRISEIRLNVGWITSIWQCGEFLVAIRDRLKNWFRALARLQRPDYCSLIGHNPELSLTFLLDITPWEDTFM
jgi:hypothetical protein